MLDVGFFVLSISTKVSSESFPITYNAVVINKPKTINKFFIREVLLIKLLQRYANKVSSDNLKFHVSGCNVLIFNRGGVKVSDGYFEKFNMDVF